MNAHEDSGKTIVIILGSGSEVMDGARVSANGKNTNLSLTNEGKMGSRDANINPGINAGSYDQAQVVIKNNGEITGGMNNEVHGEGSRLEFVNDKEGRITGGMDNGVSTERSAANNYLTAPSRAACLRTPTTVQST